ncbi:MAG: PDDEXK nuclease domain-containing protein [Deltaproteobacteria bacterium]|nr:PDDEXK nuclease domain-containing protein [Deltaproteobacteria bacterium]
MKDKLSVRNYRGKTRENVIFPIAPTHAGLPGDYVNVLNDIKKKIAKTRIHAALAANSHMVLLYWDIGQVILHRQQQEGWGAKTIDRLSQDLRDSFPDMSGFSPRNLKYMRAFATAWPDSKIVQRTVAQLPWRSNLALLDRLSDPKTRLWYAQKTIENGWSRDILALQIDGNLHQRQGKALNNFKKTLPPSDSDMAAQIFKDPYLFDFTGTADPRREREIEQSLVVHIQRFLIELGAGFAFIGRQVHLEVGDSDYYIDLLFYHVKLHCYIVIELKAVPFDPAFVGQLNLYLSVVDDLLCQGEDKPTIGLLLCKSKNQLVVEYALRDFNKPIGVAGWETKIVKALPKKLDGILPTVAEIEAEFKDTPSVVKTKRGQRG